MKKLFVLVMVIAIVIGLTGCGKETTTTTGFRFNEETGRTEACTIECTYLGETLIEEDIIWENVIEEEIIK